MTIFEKLRQERYRRLQRYQDNHTVVALSVFNTAVGGMNPPIIGHITELDIPRKRLTIRAGFNAMVITDIDQADIVEIEP